jgi:hypothetical protein
MFGHGGAMSRSASAAITGLLWAGIAAAFSLLAVAAMTDSPATVTEPGGEVSHLKGHHGPSWSAAVLAAGVVGMAAGSAGVVWGYTRPAFAGDG